MATLRVRAWPEVLPLQDHDLLAQHHPSGQSDEHQIQHQYRHKDAILSAHQPLQLAFSQLS